MNFWFQMYVPPFMVLTLYDLAFTLLMTLPWAHLLVFGTSCMWTVSPVLKLGKSHAFLLYHFTCSCFCDCIAFLDCWVWFCCSIRSGSRHQNVLEFSSSAGDERLWFRGVEIYERIARCKSSPPSMALVRLFLMVWMSHSAWPLDCALVGDVILCCMSHLCMKFLNSCAVICVPPSETMHHGMPISVKISLRCLIVVVECRLCSFQMTGNRLK